MKERPILFSGPMVRAILDGRKTQTRRVVKPRHEGGVIVGPAAELGHARETWGGGQGRAWHTECVPCPYGQPGDALWLRETWRVAKHHDATKSSDLRPRSMTVHYRAGGFACNDRPRREGKPEWMFFDEEPRGVTFGKWRPPMFMPRWASRISLLVESVRVERLQEISILDSHAEGVGGTYGETGINLGFKGANHEWDNKTAVEQYAWLWESINGAGSWDANPWVWVIEFRRVK